ncbi:MAG: FkbM family methyltransferase [Acidobacteria bacterium]|nr:FkbM family methyltransferase [Acidobacteriota bacterium]
MNGLSPGTLLRGLMRVLAFAAAWALIQSALLATLMPPFSTWTRLALVLLPAVIIAFWLVRWSLFRNQKASRFSFFVAPATCALFLAIGLAVFTTGALGSLDGTVQKLFHTKRTPAVGLTEEPKLRHRLFLTGAKLDILRALPHTGRAQILNYDVHGYLYSNIQFLFREIFVDQSYFFPDDSQHPFVIDCGSHIGMSILYAKTLYPGASVMGFEPAPGTFELLRENIRRNGLKDVVLYNKAVADKEGRMTFYGDNSVTASLIKGRDPGDAIEVEVVRLSNYIDRPVSFLKLDVEGAETLVLGDLVASSKLRMVKYMTIEYHHHIDRNADDFSGFLKMLEDGGFGYQLETSPEPFKNRSYQDIMIYAYRK